MSFLLDTCAISELVRPVPDAGVVAWVESQDEADIFLSVVTVGEIEKGIVKLRDKRKQKRLARWLQQDLVYRFGERLLPVNTDIALAWGRVLGEQERKGRPVPVLDALIAATASSHGLTVVTRNESDLRRCGASTRNPWNESAPR